MTSMHQSHHIQTYSTSSSQNLDHNLDALLDDLQTSVSRPGTSMALTPKDNLPMLNGGSFSGRNINLPPGASGYREITTTVTHETNGIPMTSREYQIEYLNPANSVTVAKERSSSPGIDYLKGAESGGRKLASSYKTESYGYKYEEKSSDGRFSRSQPMSEEMRSYGIENRSYPQEDPQNRNQSYQYSKTENYRSENTNMNKNLNDLENLLKELNDTPEPQPGMTSTPTTMRREERMSSRTLDTRSPARYDDSSNTIPKRSSSASREVTYSEIVNQRSDRGQSPYTVSGGTPKVQQRTIQRETQEYRGHTSRRDASGMDRSSEMSPSLRRRTPSPSREFRPSTFSSYPISPKDTQRTVVSKSYNYSSTKRTPTPSSQSFDEPQPYRSPSPVSFPQKRSPSPARKSVTRSDSGRTGSYQVSPSLSDPNSPTVITYKYTSHSSQHSKYPGGTYDDPDPSVSRPFPSNTPVPVEEQNPPKKLDELMASFQDSRQTSSYEYSSAREVERQNVDLQRSPSSERNVRPSDVRISQTYSQSQLTQQQQQPHHSHHHHHHHHHHKHHDHHHQQQQHQQQSQQDYQQSPKHYQQQQYAQENYAQQQYQQYQQYQQQQQHQQQYQQQQQHQQQYQQQQQHQQQFQQQQQSPINEVVPSPSSVQGVRSGASANSAAVATSTKSVAGPPVYYPPGVELFAKKEEAMEQQMYGSKGKMKGKGKMKYKYESKEKSKEKSSSGMSAVPLCLPVCCAAPCVIM